ERHAKAIYLSAETDVRPAWQLFREPQALREQVSRQYYETVQQPEEPFTLTEAARVQQFFDEEYAETTYAERYAGFYDDRPLELKDLQCLPTKANYLTGQEAMAGIEALQAGMVGPSHRPRADVDARIYLAHQVLAKETGCAAELDQRYRFHLE